MEFGKEFETKNVIKRQDIRKEPENTDAKLISEFQMHV